MQPIHSTLQFHNLRLIFHNKTPQRPLHGPSNPAAPFSLPPFSFSVLMNWWPEKYNHPEHFWAYAAGWGSPLPKWNWTRPTQAYNPFALHSCPIVFCCPTGPPCSLGDGFVLTSWGTEEAQTLVFRGVSMLQTRPDQEWNVQSRCFWWFNTFST